MNQKMREHFYKVATLIVDHTKDSFIDLLELHLTQTNLTFEDFINKNKHEIYHLCFVKDKCCLCTNRYKKPKTRGLYLAQLEILFDVSGPKDAMHTARKRVNYCCCKAKPGISTKVLDTTLARILIVNFCTETLWSSCLKMKRLKFEDFLNQNKHDLYHMFDTTSCSNCTTNYIQPVQKPVLSKSQWMNLFGTTCVRPKNNVQSYKAISGIHESNIDNDLTRILQQYFCPLFKSIVILSSLRNKVYGHATAGVISSTDYHEYVSEIENNILIIAEVCNKNTVVKQNLDDLQKRNLDETLCIQIQNCMLDQINKENDIMELIKTTVQELKNEPMEALIARTERIISSTQEQVYTPQKRPEQAAYRLLRDSSHTLILIGAEGSGKTTLAYHLMLKIASDKSVYPVLINDTDDVKIVLNQNIPSIMFIDDPFGKSNLIKSEFERWEKYFNELSLEKTDCDPSYIIIALRDSVLSACNESIKKYKLFRDGHIMNISSDKWILQYFEKQHMVEQYCNHNNIEMSTEHDSPVVEVFNGKLKPTVFPFKDLYAICSSNPLIAFPQSSSIFFNNPHIFQMGLTFFKNARQSLIQEINNLYSRDEYSRKIYATLVCMLLHGPTLCIDDLVFPVDIKRNVCALLDIKLHNKDMKNILKTESKYIKCSDNYAQCYTFSHETILERVLVSYMEESEWQEHFLKWASDNMIIEFVRSSNYKSRKGEISVNVNDSLNEKLILKLMSIYKKKSINYYSLIYYLPSELHFLTHPTCNDESVAIIIIRMFKSGKLSKRYLDSAFTIASTYGFHMIVSKLLSEFYRRNVPTDLIYNRDTECEFLSPKDLVPGICNRLAQLDDVNIVKIILEADSSLVNLKVQYYPFLLYAAKEKRKQCVEYLLHEGVCVLQRDDFEQSILMYCIFRNWFEIAKNILQQEKTLLNVVDSQGQTPFITAITYNLIDFANFLFQQQPDLGVIDDNGNSALHYSIQHQSMNALSIEIMTQRTHLLNHKNKYQETPLYLAALNRNNDAYQYLLSKEADIAITDSYGIIIFQRICCNGWLEECKKILLRLAGCGVLNHQYNNGDTAIMLATAARQLNIVQYSLEQNADTSLTNKCKESILHICARNDWPKVCENVLQRNVNLLNEQNICGNTPIMIATERRQFDTVRTLLQAGADLTIVDNNQENVLHKCNHIAGFKFWSEIIKHNDKLTHTCNKAGLSPLELLASSNDFGNCFKSVISNYKQLKIEEVDFKRLLYLAITNNKVERMGNVLTVCPSLLNMPLDSQKRTPLLLAASLGQIDCVNYLLEENADTSTKDDDFNTIIHHCAVHNLIEVELHVLTIKIELLNAQNKFGQTALMLSVLQGHHMFAKKLLERQPDTGIKDHMGNNILHFWRTGKSDMTFVFDLILRKNMGLLDKRNKDGESPLLTAAKNKHFFAVRYLLLHGANLLITDKNKNNILHLCAMNHNCQKELIEAIVEMKPCLLDAQNIKGQTPILVAAQYTFLFSSNSVCHFSDLGADITIRDLNGHNLLNYRSGFSYRSIDKCIRSNSTLF